MFSVLTKLCTNLVLLKNGVILKRHKICKNYTAYIHTELTIFV